MAEVITVGRVDSTILKTLIDTKEVREQVYGIWVGGENISVIRVEMPKICLFGIPIQWDVV